MDRLLNFLDARRVLGRDQLEFDKDLLRGMMRWMTRATVLLGLASIVARRHSGRGAVPLSWKSPFREEITGPECSPNFDGFLNVGLARLVSRATPMRSLCRLHESM